MHRPTMKDDNDYVISAAHEHILHIPPTANAFWLENRKTGLGHNVYSIFFTFFFLRTREKCLK
jgi:hypothetical protein